MEAVGFALIVSISACATTRTFNEDRYSSMRSEDRTCDDHADALSYYRERRGTLDPVAMRMACYGGSGGGWLDSAITGMTSERCTPQLGRVGGLLFVQQALHDCMSLR